MSHNLIELMSNLSGRAGEIKTKLHQASLEKTAQASGHAAYFSGQMDAIGQAFGPICEKIVEQEDGYILHLTKQQAEFLPDHLISTIGLIADGLATRVNEHSSNLRVNTRIDDLISSYSSDDFPVTIREMLSKGKTEELKEVISEALKKSALRDLDRLMDQVASIAVERAMLDFLAAPVLSQFHDIVEIGIGNHQKRSTTAASEPNGLGKDFAGAKVYHPNFRNPRHPVNARVDVVPVEILAK